MLKKTITLLSLSILLLLLSACEGATSGSVRNSSQSCRTGGGRGSCEGRMGRLSGTYGIDVEDDSISPGDTIMLDVSVSVETGNLRVFFEDPDGQVMSVEVAPGVPGQLSGYVEGEFDGFGIGFQALSESVEGVGYSLEYMSQ